MSSLPRVLLFSLQCKGEGVAVFKEPSGREWVVSLNMRQLQVMRECGDDLLAVMDEGGDRLAEFLYSKPERFTRMMWVILEKQARYRQVEPERFYEMFDGPVVDMATLALEEAIIDFFQRLPMVREAMKKSLREARAKTDAVVSLVLNDSPCGSGESSELVPGPLT
jgi:hypothetical protein